MIYTSLHNKFNSAAVIASGCRVLVTTIDGRGFRVSFESEPIDSKATSPAKKDNFDIYVLMDRLEIPRKSYSNDVSMH
jgi:hypothetical protein